jgi:hypothetical protein
MVCSRGGLNMLIEFNLKCRYNGKRFKPGQQANIPEDVAKRLVSSGAAFFVEKKVIFQEENPPVEDESIEDLSVDNDSDEGPTDEELAKKLEKLTKDQLKEAAMEVDIIIPSFDTKKGELISLIIEEGKAEEVLALPDNFDE